MLQPVLQLGEALWRIEGVDGSSEDQQLVLGQLLLDGEVVDVQSDRDVIVVQQDLLEHRRVAVLGQGLVGDILFKSSFLF